MGCGGGCGCAPCASSPGAALLVARARSGDPAAIKLLAAGGGQIGDVLPQVVYPSDVTKLKNRLNPAMVATNAGVEACKAPALSDGEREAWGVFYAAWREFYATDVPWLFGSANDFDLARGYELRLAGWQEELRKKCDIPGPVVERETPLDLSALKWVSAAVVAVAVVYAVKTIV